MAGSSDAALLMLTNLLTTVHSHTDYELPLNHVYSPPHYSYSLGASIILWICASFK